LCVPLALFFVTGDKKFVPIAIQLYQHIAPDNPVTTVDGYTTTTVTTAITTTEW